MPPKDRSKRQQVVEMEPDVEVTREYREDSESSESTIVAHGPGEPAFTPDHLQQILQTNSKHLWRLINDKQKLTGKR